MQSNDCYNLEYGRKERDVSRQSGTLRLLGVYPGGVRLQRLLAPLEGLFRGLPPVGVEDVALPHLGEPVAQLDEVDLVFLELRVGEVVLGVLLLHLLEEILAAVD